MVHDTGRPIMYHLDGTYYAPQMLQGSVEGIWWLPTSTTRDYLVLSNLSDEVTGGTVVLTDANGQSLQRALTFGPKETKRVSVRELLHSGNFATSFGGISFQSDHIGRLDAVHVIYDEISGFSATMKMFDHDPKITAKSHDYAGKGKWITRAPLLALSTPDPLLALPATTQLQPFVLLRNITTHAVAAEADFHWRSQVKDGHSETLTLGLAPGEVKKIDIAEMQSRGLIPPEANWTQISISDNVEPNELIAIATSFDKTLRLGAQTPFSDKMSAHLEGGQWQEDATHTSIIAAGNGGDVPATAVLTLFYDRGRKQYVLEKEIPANDRWVFNIASLVRDQVPDITGKILPLGTASGAYQIRQTLPTGRGLIYEGKVITDKTYGPATYAA